ncbi:MAG: hypothetical protein ABW048_06740 [Sphingobium sp.]
MLGRAVLTCIFIGLSLAFSGVVHAEWLQSSSAHFVVYSNDSPRNIRRFSEQLERYDSAMAYAIGVTRPAISPSNRVTVYIVNSDDNVRKLYGDGAKYINGFYVPRAGGSLAVIPPVTAATGRAEYSMIVLLHEYAHHFLASTSNFPIPRWMSEGSAEFFSSASFDHDGGVGLGMPAQHRANELFLARDVKVEELLDPATYEARRGKGYDAYYGKSWLLYHYLTFAAERNGQMTRYMQLLTNGKSSRNAALEAFGDFAQLEKDLDAYLGRRRMTMLQLKPSMLQTGQIDVRKLSAGEAAIMPSRIRSRRGVTPEQAKELLVGVRAIAAKFPGDAAVLASLAEAEHDAGNDKDAIAAADAALAIDPSSVDAYVQKGYALFRIATEAKDPVGAYKAARAPWIALNKLEHDHPLPLVYYYRSFAEQGVEPPAIALAGLKQAASLAPFDLSLQMMLAMHMLQKGERGPARDYLRPVAYNPHGGAMADGALKILTRLDSDPKWDGRDARTIMSAAGSESDE